MVGDPVYAGGGSRRISGRGPPGRRGARARPPPVRHCTRPLWHSAILRSGEPLEFQLGMAGRSARCTCLQWVAKTWLLAPTPWAIFFSSIEMANSPTLHAVIFRIGALICAAPAGIVREILPRLPATRIPGGRRGDRRAGQRPGHPAHRARWSRPPPAAAPEPRTRAPSWSWRSGGRRYGLGVGQVVDFLEVPAHWSPNGPSFPGIDPRLVKAVGIRDGQHFILLDIDALVAPIIGQAS